MTEELCGILPAGVNMSILIDVCNISLDPNYRKEKCQGLMIDM